MTAAPEPPNKASSSDRGPRMLTAADRAKLRQRFPKLTPLANAVLDGDLAQVSALLSSGVAVDHAEPKTPTALALAAGAGSPEVVRRLLEAGANPNGFKGALGYMAIKARNVAALQVLLEHGLDPRAKGKNGRTTLMEAAESGLVDAVDLLLERSAEVDARDGDGFTALMRAAIADDGEVVKRLVAAGADVNIISKKGNTSISLAAGLGHVGVVSQLAGAGASLSSAGEAWTPLASAAGGNRREAVTELLRLGADPNGQSQGLWTPLVIASYSGHTAILRQLLSAGAEVDRRDSKGRTALMWASWRQFRRCDEILRAAGADPTLVAPGGVRPRSVVPVPKITRADRLPRTPWYARVLAPLGVLLSPAMHWRATRRSILGFSVGTDIPKDNRALAFDVVERALRLVEKHAPSELGRLRTAFKWIIVTEIPIFQAAYLYDQGWCVLHWDPKAKPPPPSKVAALFVHEATHHRLRRCGFASRQTEILRVERACSKAALRFARRLPGSAGRQVASEHLHGITPDFLSHEAEQQTTRRVLKDVGAPRWVIPIAEWLLRKRQKRSEEG